MRLITSKSKPFEDISKNFTIREFLKIRWYPDIPLKTTWWRRCQAGVAITFIQLLPLGSTPIGSEDPARAFLVTPEFWVKWFSKKNNICLYKSNDFGDSGATNGSTLGKLGEIEYVYIITNTLSPPTSQENYENFHKDHSKYMRIYEDLWHHNKKIKGNHPSGQFIINP